MMMQRTRTSHLLSSSVAIAAVAVSCGGANAGECPTWNTMPGSPGLSSSYAAAFSWHDDGSGMKLYVTGNFDSAVGVSQTQDLARWNGGSWESVGGGLIGGFSNAFVEWQGRLYVGGYFDSAGGVSGTEKIACWNGTEWSGLGANLTGGDDSIWGMEVFEDELWVCGNFTDIGGTTADYIAKYDGETWVSVDSSASGTAVAMFDMEVFDDGSGPALYVGGRFGQIGSTSARNIAKWTGEGWEALGSGIGSSQFGSGSLILEVIDDGTGSKLWVGGQSIEQAGGMPANGIATWDGKSWAPLGSGLGSVVWDIEWFDDGTGPAVYAVGFFFDVHGSPNRIAKWNGEDWEAYGTGADDTVFGALVYTEGGVEKMALGGNFTTMDGLSSNRVIIREGCPSCEGDIDADGVVAFSDILSILAAWGPCEGCPEDLDGDGAAAFSDILIVLANWGPC